MKARNQLLFRRPVAEALPAPLLEYQSPTASLIAEPPSPIANNVSFAICVFLFVLIVLSIVVPVNIVSSGYGDVVTNSPVEVIQPVETSIVKRVDVVAGQHIDKGDVIAELDPTFTQSDLGSLQAQFDAAQTSVERLRAEVEKIPYVPSRVTDYTAASLREYQQDEAQFNSTVESYDTKIKSLQAALQSDQSQLASYQQQLAIANQVMAKRQELFNLHVGAQLDLLSAQAQSDQLAGEVQSTMAAVEGARQDLASMIAEENAYQESFYAQQNQSLAGEAATMDDANSQLSKDLLRRKLDVIRADRSGSVLTVATAAPGTVVQSGDQLVTIQPDDGKVEVIADFPSEQSGAMQIGQHVYLKFDAFNYVAHGYADGTLVSLTSSSFLPGTLVTQLQQGLTNGPASPNTAQTSLPTTQVITGLFYQATISIDKLHMRGVPKSFKPSPGMAVTADDITGSRNILTLLAEKIAPAFIEAGHGVP